MKTARQGSLTTRCVVAGYELSRAVGSVELEKRSSASARTLDKWVLLIGTLSISFSVGCPVVRYRRLYLQILRTIVRLVSIDVMDNFPRPQWPAQLFLSNKTVLIHVASDISQVMTSFFDQNITGGRNSPSAKPIRVPITLVCSHTHRIASRNQHKQYIV